MWACLRPGVRECAPPWAGVCMRALVSACVHVGVAWKLGLLTICTCCLAYRPGGTLVQNVIMLE